MTRYLCGSCGNRMDVCRCDAPAPTVEGRSARLSARPWTRAEVVELLAEEARQQERVGRARVDDVRERKRLRRQD